MQRQRSPRTDEARIYDSWIDDPGPFIDLTVDSRRPLIADGSGAVPVVGNSDPGIARSRPDQRRAGPGRSLSG